MDCRVKFFAIATLGFGLVLANFGSAQAAGVEWRTNLKKAAKESKQTQKPMLLKISAEWCGPCKKMKKSYDTPAVARHVNANFIPIAVDADRNEKLVDAIGVEHLPTTVILTSNYEVVKKIRGYLPPEKLGPELKGPLAKEATQTAVAQSRTPSKQGSSKVQPVSHSFAFEQICLVSLKDKHDPVSGKPEFSSTYRNKQVCFASLAAKQKFDSDPEQYWPALNGACAVTLADKKEFKEGKPKYGAVYKGELWFFHSVAARNKFKTAPKTYAQP